MGSQGTEVLPVRVAVADSGPGGIIAADDVVVIKINYQWDERGGTNTDLLRGLIRAIVDHPDSFTGEVVVCENAQFNSVNGFDRTDNNAQDTTLSPHDVVVGFQGLGYTVSHYDWTSIRYTSVDEFSEGDIDDGYIVYAYDPQISGRVSYPKFQTERRDLHQPEGRHLGPGHIELRPRQPQVHQPPGAQVPPRDLRGHGLRQALHGCGHPRAQHQLAQRHRRRPAG